MTKNISIVILILFVSIATRSQTSFSNEKIICFKNSQSSASIGDFDGDGDVDVLAGVEDFDQIELYGNLNSSGVFGMPHTINIDEVISSFVADLDGDGDLDILCSVVDYNNDIVWLENIDGNGNFAEQQTISSVESISKFIFATDIDGDGDLDVLSASGNNYTDKISWYENMDGTGTFGPQQVITTEINDVQSVFAIDLDNDNDIDVVSASHDDDKIAWYENMDGNGNFSTPIIISTVVNNAWSVIAFDIDGDGDNDVLSSSSNGSTLLAWFENIDGLGNFGTQQIISINAGSKSLNAADIDEDGDMDILSAGLSISWYENIDENGNFDYHQINTQGNGFINNILTADIDADGDLDVVTGASNWDGIAWYSNLDGNGYFGEEQLITTHVEHATSVYASDLDLDGDMDVLSAGDYISIYYNLDGNGYFGTQNPITNPNVEWSSHVEPTDMDGDGDLDILSTLWGTDKKIIWNENFDGNGNFGLPQTVGREINSAICSFARDIDGDGDKDVVSASLSDETIVWYENMDGNENFYDKIMIDPAANGVRELHMADMDSDGDIDVLSIHALPYKIAWYENLDGSGNFSEQQIITTTLHDITSIYTTDIDGDGDNDLIAATNDYYDGVLAWYENLDNNGNFGAQQIIISSSMETVYAADIDADGDMDVLSSYGSSVWFENLDGNGNFGIPQNIMSSSGSITAASDIDGDDDIDVLVASGTYGMVSWCENIDGNGNFTQHIITTELEDAHSAYAGDFDGDGDMDILTHSIHGTYSGPIYWFKNLDGIGNFGEKQIIAGTTSYATSVFSSNLDGDGDMDVLSASGSKIAWYDNLDGNEKFGSQKIISTNDDPSDVYACDIDGDGDSDVLSAFAYENKVAWYENLGGNGNFGEQQVITTSANGVRSVHAADLDGDGDLDVLSASVSDNAIAWHENLDGNGNFGPEQLIHYYTYAKYSVFAADLDDDGDMDVLSASIGRIAWYENIDGLGSFGPQQIITTDISYGKSVFASDMDNDGDIDVLSASDDKIAWYENLDGIGTFSEQQVISINADNAKCVYTTDIDGDGDMDVLSASYNDAKIAWYENLLIMMFLQHPQDKEICPGFDTYFTISINNPNGYQWQVNEGNGFTDLFNNSMYQDVTTDSLQITAAGIAMSGFLYRCAVNIQGTYYFSNDATLTVEDNTNPEIDCVNDQTINLPEGIFNYIVEGTEFDPVSVLDNCEVTSVVNSFNDLSTLEDAEFPTDTTTVIWTVTDASGNYNECSFEVIVNLFVGIETLQQYGISIFPNPSNGEINFEFGDNHIQKIKVSDLNGKTIFEKTKVNQSETINISSIEPGVYMVSLQTENEVLTTKIVKE